MKITDVLQLFETFLIKVLLQKKITDKHISWFCVTFDKLVKRIHVFI